MKWSLVCLKPKTNRRLHSCPRAGNEAKKKIFLAKYENVTKAQDRGRTQTQKGVVWASRLCWHALKKKAPQKYLQEKNVEQKRKKSGTRTYLVIEQI
jgi:hypothetical protein